MADEIVFVSPGYRPNRQLRQPWCCIYQLALAYGRRGCLTRVLTDEPGGHTMGQRDGDPTVEYVGRLRGLALKRNEALERALMRERPSLIVWNTGLTHLLHAWPPHHLGIPVIGLVASPLHTVRQFVNLGASMLRRNWREAAVHLLASVVPPVLVRRTMPTSRFRCVVTLSEATRGRLLAYGFSAGQVAVVRPGVESEWIRRGQQNGHGQISASGSPIVAYFGDAAEIRGTHILVKAAASIAKHGLDLRLHMFLRDDHDSSSIKKLSAVIQKSRMTDRTTLTTGWLARDELIGRLSQANVIALPFQIFPSDALLSILEAQALGKPLVTTSIAGLPEMTPPVASCRVPPGDVDALAQALTESLSMPKGATGPIWRRTWDDFAREFIEVAGQIRASV